MFFSSKKRNIKLSFVYMAEVEKILKLFDTY